MKTEKVKSDMLTKAVPGPEQESGAAGMGLQMLCAGALWPMPAWVWRDVRSILCVCGSVAITAIFV